MIFNTLEHNEIECVDYSYSSGEEEVIGVIKRNALDEGNYYFYPDSFYAPELSCKALKELSEKLSELNKS